MFFGLNKAKKISSFDVIGLELLNKNFLKNTYPNTYLYIIKVQCFQYYEHTGFHEDFMSVYVSVNMCVCACVCAPMCVSL